MRSAVLNLLALALVVHAQSCPYANVAGDVLTAGGPDVGGFCSPGTVYCRVNSACVEVWNSKEAGKYKVTNVTRLGDLSRYTQQGLMVQNSIAPVTFDPLFVLPNRLTAFGLENCSVTDANIPTTLKWPPTMDELYLSNNQLRQVPANLPATMSELWLDGNQLRDFPRDPIVVNKILALHNNLISAMDFNYTVLTNVLKLHLSGNPLTRINQVTFHPRLITFKCAGCNIATFQLSGQSLNVLNALGPYNTANETGFLVGSVTFNATACQEVKGQQGLLQNQFPVCVTDPITSSSTTNIHTIIWPVLAGVTCIAVGVFVLHRRRHQAKSSHDATTILTPQVTSATPGPLSHYVPPPAASTNATTITTTHLTAMPYAQMIDTAVAASTPPLLLADPFAALLHWKIDAGDIELQHLLSKGAFGQVWHGTYKSEIPVAVKTLLPHLQMDARAQRAFLAEVTLLTRLNCPYIVRCLGVAWTELSDVQCVVEFMDQCDLMDFLAKTNPISFPWHEKVRVASAVAEALAYLHTVQVIHRDLKSKNVLLDSRKGAKLGDFGISRDDASHDAAATMTAGVGTPRWTAPEVLSGNQYTVAADIYSFGIVLAELDTHTLPFANAVNPDNGMPLVDSALVSFVMQGKLTPSFLASCPPFIRDLARQCVANDPTHRPTATQLALALRSQSMTGHGV
ncbi:Aste57867_21333 [Aphanomyces stellatus]|uniref:Aste57867_21333 protein n=1 Tax=Aphanomyces stellatus TaxID=120398 RepID=A0A485LH72_9STRA|nr:hypothetical protein As57867_021264 [Aphanomyces stellatus]VFT98005.1 Aste57867_21333 [Aphanomyces stellatus]